MNLYKYIRLSSEDGDVRPGEKLESNSISNQRALLDDYIGGKADLSAYNIRELCDDGYSGMNFDRPAVSKLLELAKAGTAHIIIVKDFSRFGRNYLEVGNFLEKIFPFLGVRFISVNDGYDSQTEKYGTAGDLNIGVKNLINEMYSRDLSVRVKTAHRQYAQRGEHISAYSIYGYLKSKENKRQWVIDPIAAAIVQKIFEQRRDGQDTVEIASALNATGAPTPMRRKKETGAVRQRWNSDRTNNEWTNAMVLKILREERYTGKLISGKWARYEVGNSAVRPQPEEQWIVAEHVHPAIVSEALFCAANTGARRKAAHTGTQPKRSVFYRKLKCGYCGLALSEIKGKAHRYVCWNHRAMQDGSHADCASAVAHHDALVSAVLAAIRFYAGLAADMEQRAGENRQDVRNLEAEANALEKRIEKQKRKKAEAFRRYNCGALSREHYDVSCRAANTEIASLTQRLAQMQYKATHCEESGARGFTQAASGLDSIVELNFERIDRLIEKILVFAEDRIEIIWKFENPFAKSLG